MSSKRRGEGSFWPEAGGFRARDPVGTRKWFPTKEKAKSWLRKRRAAVKRLGTDVMGPGGKRPEITFGQMWDSYRTDLLPAKPATTARIERQAWARCLGWVPEGRLHPAWQTQRIADVTTESVDRYKRHRAASGHSPATVSQELSLLRRLANIAVDRGYCRSPRVRWGVPRPVARKPTLVSGATFEKLQLAANARQRALLRWFWDTGARPNELLLIRREDLRKDGRVVFIPTPKTGRRKGVESRRFPLTEEMVEVIEERDRWLEAIVANGKGRFGIGPRQARAQLESEWLFPGVKGGRMARNGYRESLGSAFEKAGVRGRDFYAFRHSYCTRWLAAGGDPITLAHLTGTSVEMIAKTYGHLDLGWVRKIQDRMRDVGRDPDEVRDHPAIPYQAEREAS